jgi:outer membrane protein OmpA-like peptidoglycan-associated protein
MIVNQVRIEFSSHEKGYVRSFQKGLLVCVHIGGELFERALIFSIFAFSVLASSLKAQDVAVPGGPAQKDMFLGGVLMHRAAGSLTVRRDTVEYGAPVPETVQSVVVRRDTSTVLRWISMVDEVHLRDSLVARSDSAAADSLPEKPAWVALKNNLLYDAVLTPNLQAEFRLAPHWTMEIGAGFNPFPLDDTKLPKWRHVLAWVEPKYWFCGAFTRDFIAFNAAYSHYNVAGGKYPVGWIYKDVLDNRFEGDAVMAGLSYGWHFPVSTHFSIELEAGVDAGYTWFDRFECQHCGKRLAREDKWFAVPKAGVNLVVLLGGDKPSFRKRCDCGKDEPMEHIYVADSVRMAVVDTVVVTHSDTLIVEPFVKPAPVVVTEPEPVPVEAVDSAALEHEQEMQRIRRGVFRPYDEYVPYTRDMVLSSDPDAVYIHFDLSRSIIDRSYMHNDELLDSIMSFMDEYIRDTTIQIRLIRIVGMASFDGKLAGNERLAQNRALALQNYIQKRYPLPDSLFVLGNGGEGWSELKWHLDKYEFEGKEDVLRLIETEADLDRREMLIKRLRKGKVYEFLKEHVTKYQRNSGNLIVYYDIKE